MGTVQQLVDASLRLIGVLDSGETPAASEANDAFAALNQIVSGWSGAGVPIYQTTYELIPMTGALNYPLAVRPVKLKSAHVTANGISMPAEIVTSERWSKFKDRSLISRWAQELYWDGGYPVSNLYLWPAPISGGVLELYSLKPLTAFSSLSSVIDLPPGYEQGLKFALAQVLAPEYGSALSPELANEAKGALAAINAMVLGPPQGAAGTAPPPAPPVAA
jgi:hypothetical protein